MEIIDYKGYKIKIDQDDCPLNPRKDWDHGTTIMSTTRNLPDESNYIGTQDMKDIKKYFMFNKSIYAILPLYFAFGRYNTCSISTEHKVSSQIGWIYITKDDFHKLYYSSEEDFKVYHPDITVQDYCRNIMVNTIQVYEDYLNGKVYWYKSVTPDGEDLESCGGFFGEHRESGLLAEAKAEIDYHIKKVMQDRSNSLKCYIKSKVSLIHRELQPLNEIIINV
jgi:hypothetical protein